MRPMPSREELESMKRSDLQKLCKDYGVKANLKTEALIDLLLNEIQSTPQPSQRSVPRRVSSRIGTRPRGKSGGSMIVHDTDDEENTDDDKVVAEPGPEPKPQAAPAPTNRTRKAKETQTRLGVGRPVIAGGSGARAVTKPPSVSKQKKGKNKSMKPTEATIPEELESDITDQASQKLSRPPEPDSSEPRHDSFESELAQRPSVLDSNALASLDVVERQVAEALTIHEQLQSLKTELGQMQSLPTEVAQLSSTLADYGRLQLTVKGLAIAIDDIRSQFSSLSADVKHLRDLVMTPSAQTRTTGLPSPLGSAFQSSSKKASGTAGLSFGLPSTLRPSTLPHSSQPPESTAPVASTSKSALPHPGFAPSTLGKRPRDSATSNMTGIFDEGQDDEYTEAELVTKVSRPNKKKARLSHGGEGVSDKPPEEGSSHDTASQPAQEEEVGEEPANKPRIPSFTVFSGPEEPPEEYIDPPPPTNPLPESFAPSSPPPSRPTTSTAHAAENQNPFAFPFVPHAAAGSMFPINLPHFPFPEPPQSPSPRGPSAEQRGASSRQDPTSIFQPTFGVPPRPRSGIREPGGGFIDPAALMRPPDRPPTSNDIAIGLGLTAVRTPNDGRDQNLPPMKRTMYGTELEGDTRFGDFGVEGVGSGGFWTTGRF